MLHRRPLGAGEPMRLVADTKKLAKAGLAPEADLDAALSRIQNDLFDLGADLGIHAIDRDRDMVDVVPAQLIDLLG